MKKWVCFLLMLAGSGYAGAQTVGDKPTRFMMIVGGSLMTPLKSDLVSGMGERWIRAGFSGGLHYYYNENWGIGMEGHVMLLPYIHTDRKVSFYRKGYIPESYREMELKGGKQTLESAFIAGGAFYRNNVGILWLEAGLLAGMMVFDAPSASNERSIYYKEEGTNFIHRHTISDLDQIKSFAVSPQISAQYKLNSRLGLAMNLGIIQSVRKVGYTMTLTDIFYQEDKVVESFQGRVNAPRMYSKLSLILNFKAIGKKD